MILVIYIKHYFPLGYNREGRSDLVRVQTFALFVNISEIKDFLYGLKCKNYSHVQVNTLISF